VLFITDSFFDVSYPFIDDNVSFSVDELINVVGFDRFLIVACNSDRSCCKARLNLSNLSSLTSNCRFSFSNNLNLKTQNKI